MSLIRAGLDQNTKVGKRMLVKTFEESMTPYEVGLVSEFGKDRCPYEAIAFIRWVQATKCEGDESKRKREYPCIAGDEPVFLPRGIVPIKDAPVDHGFVRKFMDSGEKEAFRVLTELGYETTCTAEHRIKTPDGFVECQNLVPGSEVLIGHGIPEDGDHQYEQAVSFRPLPMVGADIEISADLAELLGLFMGDGSFHKSCVSIACDAKDQDVVDRVMGLLDAHLGGQSYTRTTGSKGGCTEVRISNVRFEPVFNALGLLRQNSSKAWKRNVHVPDYIKTSPAHVVRAFLRGLFEADGFAQKNGTGVKFFTKYETFSRDVQLLLLRMGISCRRSRHDKKSGGGHDYIGWELSLRTEESIAFAREIGFLSKRKQERSVSRGGSPRRGTRKPIAHSDRIRSIEPVGIRRVYDISTATQEFVAGGIVVHNCRPEEAFEYSAESVLDPAQLAKWAKAADLIHPKKVHFTLVENRRAEIELTVDEDPIGRTSIYRDPVPDEQYVMAVDPNGGSKDDNGDWCVAIVLRVEDGEQVAEFRARMDQDQAIDQIEALGYYYNQAFTGVEANTYGIPFCRALEDRGTLPMYEREIPDKRQPNVVNKFMGWLTTAKTRNSVFTEIRRAVREGVCPVRSKETIGEMRTLCVNRNPVSRLERIEARQGCHDDGVMAYGIALMMRNRQAGPEAADDGAPAGEPDINDIVKDMMRQSGFEKPSPGNHRLPFQRKLRHVHGTATTIDGRRNVL